MRIKCDKTVLVEALNIVTKAVPSRSTISIFEGVRLEATANGHLILAASNYEISIMKTVDVTVEEEGTVVVMAKLFNDIIKKMPDEVISITHKVPENVVIKSGNASFKVVAFTDELPTLQLAEMEEKNLCLKSNQFSDMIKQTSFSASTDNMKGVLNGILIEISEDNIRMVAIDGYRLALANQKVDCEEKCKFIISAQIMDELCRIIVADSEATDLYIHLGTKKAQIEVGNTTIVLRLMEYEYVKYEDIIPKKGNTNITVNRAMLYACLERASLFATLGMNNLIKMEVENNIVIVTSRSESGNVTEKVPVDMCGESLLIGFNSKFLLDALKAIDDEEITMQFDGPTSPCVIRPTEEDKYEYLILPVKI